MKSLQKFSEISEDECTKINGGGLLLDGFGYWGIATAIVDLVKKFGVIERNMLVDTRQGVSDPKEKNYEKS